MKKSRFVLIKYKPEHADYMWDIIYYDLINIEDAEAIRPSI
jgi:hypothetical protein